MSVISLNAIHLWKKETEQSQLSATYRICLLAQIIGHTQKAK